MKDYLNSDERNQVVSLLAMSQQIEGIRTMTGREHKPIWQDWKERGFLGKDEGKYIKTAHTYLLKFCSSVMERLDAKESAKIVKQLEKFDFRIVDDFTMKKIYRDINDRMQNAVVPRKQFDTWCEQIMECNCKNCGKHWGECELYKVFDENFTPESGYDKENCRFAYDKEE